MDSIVDWNMRFFDKFYEEIGDLIDVFWVGDDWGIQSGPLISPDYFRAEVVPRFKKMISFIKTKTDAKCCYHTCGSTYWCLDDLIEMGVDIVQPLQANAEGNDTKIIKKEFGDRLVFHGGTNNQGVFHKDIHTLTIDTLTRIKDLAPGGGYIFSSGHNIQANMPPENIIRLFELGREYGKYPIDIDSIDARIEEEKELLEKDSSSKVV
jgi:uroporphyrinogen decarboxylase